MNEEDGILVDEYLTTGGFITMVEEDEDGNFVEIDNEKQDDNNSNKAIATQPEELPKEFICPFVPTSTGRIIRFLEKVSIKENDIVLDLGSGDGRVIIDIVKQTKCNGIGIEVSRLLCSAGLKEICLYDNELVLKFLIVLIS